jgi:hypothetical protein
MREKDTAGQRFHATSRKTAVILALLLAVLLSSQMAFSQAPTVGLHQLHGHFLPEFAQAPWLASFPAQLSSI